MASEGLQILTYARHSWPESSEGSLACHTYYDKLRGIRLYWSSPRTRDTHTYHYLFYDLGLSLNSLHKNDLAKTLLSSFYVTV